MKEPRQNINKVTMIIFNSYSTNIKGAYFLSILLISALSAQGMDPANTSSPKKRKNFISRAFQSIRISNKTKKKSSKIKNLKLLQSEAINPLFDNNILGLITEKICLSDWKLRELRTNIRQFSRVNRFLYKYYTNEKIAQNIIRLTAIHTNHSDLYIAGLLGYQKIRVKIYDLLYKSKCINENFTDEDLQDKWYLNITYTVGENTEEKFTLLLATIANMDAAKTTILLEAGADYNNNRCVNPIRYLTGQHLTRNNYFTLYRGMQEKYFIIINKLLEKKVDPDARLNAMFPTLLHRAAFNGDKVFAHLLLVHGANPHKLYLDFYYRYKGRILTGPLELPVKLLGEYSKKYPCDTLYTKTDNDTKPWKYNAFLLEESKPKGWLKTMYHEIQGIQQ